MWLCKLVVFTLMAQFEQGQVGFACVREAGLFLLVTKQGKERIEWVPFWDSIRPSRVLIWGFSSPLCGSAATATGAKAGTEK